MRRATSGPAAVLTAAVVTAAMVIAVTLVGCTPEPEPAPAPSGFADEDAAFAAAEATYRAYVDALNRVDLSDPETFEDVYRWTTGDLNASDRKNFSAWHADGYSIQGEARIISVRFLAVADNEVSLHACYDVSGVDVRDASGASLVTQSRPDVQSLLVTTEVVSDVATTLLVSAINPSKEGMSC